MTNLFTTFSWGTPADRERPLLTTRDGTTFSYADAWHASARIADFLTAAGLEPGDLGTFCAAGYLTIMGRSKDMIISGGLNVCPREVEQAIDALNGVIESAVIGVPHPDFGEGVIAIAVLEPDFAPVEQDMLVTLSGRLANFKRPKRLFFV